MNEWGDSHSLLTPIVLQYFTRPNNTAYEMYRYVESAYGDILHVGYHTIRDRLLKMEGSGLLERKGSKLIHLPGGHRDRGRDENRDTYVLTEKGWQMLGYWHEFFRRVTS